MIATRTGTGVSRAALALTTFILTLTVRIQGISSNFWLLRDQIRDWETVQGSLRDLPLVGPATHVGGYTIGPAFYWILWVIRVTLGPWFDNLPHAGGIGQAALQSATDAVLLLAIWKRTGSVWNAVTIVTLLATAGFDLCLAAVIWNPVVGSTLAKLAVALVLLDWHRGSPWRLATTAAVAWMAVHAYTGAIYVSVSVLALMLLMPVLERRWLLVRRNVGVVALVIAILQIPYLWYQVATRFRWQAMGAVTGSVARVLTGSAQPEIAKSVNGFVAAFNFIEVAPWSVPLTGTLLLICAVIVILRYRTDPTLIVITIAPPVLAIVGYALFLGALDHYYYLSLMPSTVLMVVLALTAAPWPRVAQATAVVLCLLALTLVPSRVRFGSTMNRMPEYRVLVQASRVLVNRGVPMRAIRTNFPLPPTGDPEFIYRLLGGRFERTSRWIAVIDQSGKVSYQDLGGA